MASVRYAPGESRLVVTGQGVILLNAEMPAALLVQIWEQVEAGRGLPAVLEALTGAFGTSIATIPSFAVALAEGAAVRLAVRGALSIDVTTTTGADTANGTGVTTWTERVIDDARTVTVTPTGGAAAPVEFPIRDGVVLASAVEWVLDPVASADADAGSSADADAAVVIAIEVADSDVADIEPVDSRADLEGAEPADAEPEEADPAGVHPVDDDRIGSDLIDSIPIMTSSDTWLPPDVTYIPEPAAEPAPEPTPEPTPEPESEPVGSAPGDEAWGATTVIRRLDSPVTTGDHDGETISVAQARALRTDATASDSTPPPPLAPPRPQAPGRVRLSTGQEYLLDRTVVIGRRPRSTRVTGTDLPHLVAVDSPQQDISRSHLELRVEGDSIIGTDLNTTNGTTLHRSGAEPVRLHPGEQTVVVPGDLLDLGDGVTVTVSALDGESE